MPLRGGYVGRVSCVLNIFKNNIMKSFKDFKRLGSSSHQDSEYSEYLRIYFTGLAMQGLISGGMSQSSEAAQKKLAIRAGEIAKETLKINMP